MKIKIVALSVGFVALAFVAPQQAEATMMNPPTVTPYHVMLTVPDDPNAGRTDLHIQWQYGPDHQRDNHMIARNLVRPSAPRFSSPAGGPNHFDFTFPSTNPGTDLFLNFVYFDTVNINDWELLVEWSVNGTPDQRGYYRITNPFIPETITVPDNGQTAGLLIMGVLALMTGQFIVSRRNRTKLIVR